MNGPTWTTHDRLAIALLALTFWTAGCSHDGSPAAAIGEPGTPIPGLDPTSLGRFNAGHALFNKVFTPEEGLGPTFNENQCSACHTSPASGGVGGERVLKATLFDETGSCDQLTGQGGENIRRKVTRPGTAAGVAREAVPQGATPGRFTAPALYGRGLVEAIPDSVLLALADPEDADGDGVSGRVGRSADGRVARFGRKADVATLREFVAGAAHLEMGLTSAAHTLDLAHGQPVPSGADRTTDPELANDVIDLLTDYVRFLAPPGQGSPPAPWAEADVARGEQSFLASGCAGCHVPRLTTGASPVPQLRNRKIVLYSDLLLHDMGPALADVCGPAASPSEVRTEPLLGLRYRERLMHDGRVTHIEDAIRLHDGESRSALEAFLRLSPRAQAELVAFLQTL
jgi:CxxC motif-containing protein (DUF1111 family)